MFFILVSYTHPLKILSHTIAWLDVSLSFASVSVNAPKPYIRPKLREKGMDNYLYYSYHWTFLSHNVKISKF